MAATLAHLAMHPEEQARAYEAVKLATDGRGDPVSTFEWVSFGHY